MNVILFELYGVNGALIDALEYYLYMKSIGKDVKLGLIKTPQSISMDEIYRVISDRYDISFDFKSDIIVYHNKSDIIRAEFNNVLIVDYTTLEVVPIIRSKCVHILYDHNPLKKKLYNILRGHDHIKLYNEMPFGMGDYYLMKFPFDLYKRYDECLSRCYVNCSGKSDLSRIRILTDKEVMVTGYKGEPLDGAIIYNSHPKEFFSLFDTYLYIHDGKYFEPRCRLLFEACFYNKTIIYDNPHQIKDGGYYRLKEIKESGVSKRHMTPQDEIVEVF